MSASARGRLTKGFFLVATFSLALGTFGAATLLAFVALAASLLCIASAVWNRWSHCGKSSGGSARTFPNRVVSK